MSRLAIRNAVIEATGRSDKTDLINSAINTAVSEVSAARAWSDLLVEADVALAQGDLYVTLASDVIRLLEVRLIDGSMSRPLRIRPKTWVTNHWPNAAGDSQASPVYGYLEGIKLYVVPVPQRAFTLRYTYARNHPPLTSDASTVIIRHATAAVTAYATFWVFQSTEKHGDAKEWLKTYETLLAQAKKVDADNPAVEYVAIPRGQEPRYVGDYWNDPFVRELP